MGRIINKSNNFRLSKLKHAFKDPDWTWGLRVALSTIVPIIWGIFTQRLDDAFWMAIAAQCVSFIDMRGLVDQHLRMIISASILCLVFAVVGTVTGQFPILNIIVFFFVGFLSGLFKNLGPRGAGLALSVYVFYILTSTAPLTDWGEIWYRLQFIAIGALWAVIIELANFFFIKTSEPYRRPIAEIWSNIGKLAGDVGAGWDGIGKRKSIRQIFLSEKEVMTAMEEANLFFEEAEESMQSDQLESQAIAQSYRAASITSLYIMQVAEMVQELPENSLSSEAGLQIYSIFRSLQQIGERMEVFIFTFKSEEIPILESRMERLSRAVALLEQLPEVENNEELIEFIEKLNLAKTRISRVVNHAISLIKKEGEISVFSSYSFVETLQILHPKYIKNNILQVLNFNSFTTRYAVRVGFSTMLAAIAAYAFFPDHGHWIILTTIIVAQPYFGATLKRGIERSIGTVAGIIIGTGVLLLPYPDLVRLVLVFFSCVLLVYFLKRSYSLAAFFITLMLVGLVSLAFDWNPFLLQWRVAATIIGSAIAIFSGFVMMPVWDSKEFPNFLAQALNANMNYFVHTFYADHDEPWLKDKTEAETANSQAFDSLSRTMREPTRSRKLVPESYFQTLTHYVRVTRELSNYNGELENDDYKIEIKDKEKFIQYLHLCDDTFREIARLMRKNGNLFIPESHTKTFPENGFKVQTPSKLQWIYVQKLYAELQFILEEEKAKSQVEEYMIDSLSELK